MAKISFARTLPTSIKSDQLVLIGTKRALKSLPAKLYPKASWLDLAKTMLADAEAGPLG